MVNQGGTMDKKDLVTPKGVYKDTEIPLKKYGKGESKKNLRVTKTRIVGIQDDTVEIKIASSDENYVVTLDSFDSE